MYEVFKLQAEPLIFWRCQKRAYRQPCPDAALSGRQDGRSSQRQDSTFHSIANNHIYTMLLLYFVLAQKLCTKLLLVWIFALDQEAARLLQPRVSTSSSLAEPRRRRGLNARIRTIKYLYGSELYSLKNLPIEYFRSGYCALYYIVPFKPDF